MAQLNNGEIAEANAAAGENYAPRVYRMGKREAAKEATGARILAAARELILGKNALSGFSMELVARAAGVTRVTIYHRFGSKAGLLGALLDGIAAEGQIRAHLERAFERESAPQITRAFCRAFCGFYATDRILMRRLRAFGELDDELGAVIAGRDARRAGNIRQLLRLTKPNDSSHAEPHRVLMALTKFEFYDALAEQNEPAEVAQILFGLVAPVLGLEENG